MIERLDPRRVATVLAAMLVGVASPLAGQWTATVTVTETAGIRRTAFPTTARFEVPRGRAEYVSQFRLGEGSDVVPSQATAWSHWDDGSIRDVEVDFNLSIGPLEDRRLELSYGTDVTGQVPSGRGLSVSEGGRSIEVGPVQVNKGGYTLVAGVAYRDQIIAAGRNGLTIVERSGIRRDPREISWRSVELRKSGPLRVLLRYEGTLPLSGGSEAELTLDVDMPNSKSWLQLSVTASDPDAKIGDIGFETPFDLGAYPWTWDFATPTGTYGAFRDPTGSAIFTRTLDAQGSVQWEVRSGAAGSEQAHEVGGPIVDGGAATWAHLSGPDEAVAFAVSEDTGQPGSISMWLTGVGQTTVTFRSAEPTTEHAFTVVQHYVGTPVPIGAATSPASILSPLAVTVE
jgi:hypothetical protein